MAVVKIKEGFWEFTPRPTYGTLVGVQEFNGHKLFRVQMKSGTIVGLDGGWIGVEQ